MERGHPNYITATIKYGFRIPKANVFDLEVFSPWNLVKNADFVPWNLRQSNGVMKALSYADRFEILVFRVKDNLCRRVVQGWYHRIKLNRHPYIILTRL